MLSASLNKTFPYCLLLVVLFRGLLPIDDSQAFCIPPSLQDQVDTFQSQYEEDVAIQNDEVAQNLFM